MDLLDRAAERLRAAGIEQPRKEARLLLAHAMNVSQESLIAEDVVPDADALSRFEDAVTRRAAREPFAYIVGKREFWSLDIAVGPGVLIPRPETETLVEQALLRLVDPAAPLRVLDLGTGSGCVLLAFLSERAAARGIGVDLSADALGYANRSAQNLGLADRVRFIAGDWKDAPDGPFDVIFVNPPYVTTGDVEYLEADVANHEPHLALDGGEDGLDHYRTIAPLLAQRLAPEGVTFVELGYGLGEDVARIFAAAPLAVEELAPDLSSIARCLVARKPPAQSANTPKKDVEMTPGSG